MPARILFVASECAPMVKTGGLGDVAGSLPPALRALGHDVRLLLPGYPAVRRALADAREVASLAPAAMLPAAALIESRTRDGVPVYAIVCDELYERPGGPYQDAQGHDWSDNARRFAMLSHVAARIAHASVLSDWQPDVLHAHDWQAGLAPAYVALGGDRRTATLFTIHNLAFQGLFDPGWLHALDIPAHAFAMHGVEYYGKLSFMKAGLYYAHAISTVSPGYAREIQSPPLGMGLEGLLQARRDDVHGILNGIDERVWNPRTDPLIAARYSERSLWRKAGNKRALQQRLGLDVRADLPLFGVVSRLTEQKGIDLVLAIGERLLSSPAQLVVLGTGDRALERAALVLPARFPGKAAAVIGFEEALAHAIEAGADAFLMPSRFEPCGMNQMYSQRYGTPPIVHATGGLRDSVVDCTPGTLADGTASGFLFDDPSPGALAAAIDRCITQWRDKAAWKRLQRNGMARDLGWSNAAAAYGRLYEALAAFTARPSARARRDA